MKRSPTWIGLLGLGVLAAAAARADSVTFRTQQGQTITVAGNVLAEDSYGSILLEGRDTQHYIIAAKQIQTREKSSAPVELYSKQELRAALEKEFGPQFKIEQTSHYLVVYSCDDNYAKWASELFERAFKVFKNYFKTKGGFRFEDPAQPLIAIIYGSREEYVKGVVNYLGALAENTAGVYMPYSNRMYMYNALGGKSGGDLKVLARVNRDQAAEIDFLMREQNISVIIHEGIHQIAFNAGFHHRHVQNPLWLVEGMAMFFESPDMSSKKGWKGIGEVNRERLDHFVKIFSSRSPASLQRLVLDDGVLRDPKTANDAYAEAWAFTYFLARTKTRSYTSYLKIINQRPAMVDYTPEERLTDFRKAFGNSPAEMAPEFHKYLSRHAGNRGQ